MRLAHDLRGQFTRGVLWVNFGTKLHDPEILLNSTIRTWSQNHHPGRLMQPESIKPEQMHQWLADFSDQLLIVFDDVWHARPAQELLSIVPKTVKLVITTRRADIARRLGITPDQQYEISRFTEDDGVMMLRDRVGDIPAPAALRQIVGLLDGHPLALEIVAAQINSRGPDYADSLPDILSEQLNSSKGLGVLQIEGEESRYTGIEAALSLTYDQMSEDLKRRFRYIGILAPDALLPRYLLSAVWGDSLDTEAHRADSVERMNTLASIGVLSKAGNVYSQHGLVRTYAKAYLEKNDEVGTASKRYTEYIVYEKASQFEQLSLEDWDNELGLDLPHIQYIGDLLVHATQTLVLGDNSLELITQPAPPETMPKIDQVDSTVAVLPGWGEFFAATTKNYVYHRYPGKNGQQWLRMGLACARLRGNRERESTFLFAIGLWHDQQGQPEVALSFYSAYLTLVREVGNRANEATALSNMAMLYDVMDQKPRALELLEQALLIHREVGDRENEATDLNNMGLIYGKLGLQEKALDLFEQALPIRHEVSDLAGEATTLNNMSYIYFQRKDVPNTVQILRQVLQKCRDAGVLAVEAGALLNLAVVLHEGLGQTDEAVDLVKRSITILEQLDLAQDAYDQTLEQHQAFLVKMTGEFSIIADAIVAFAKCNDWDTAKTLVMQRADLLLRPDANGVIDSLVRAATEEPIRKVLEESQFILALCRDIGIEEAFRELQK